MLISKFPDNNVATKIIEIETHYNISFPIQYRNFLLRYNGGDTPNTKYKNGKKNSELRGFYGFGDVRYSFDKFEDIQKWIENMHFPIACDLFGNYISIDLNDGSIYFVDHEEGYRKSLICTEFTTFIKQCKSELINEKSRRSIKEREEDMIAKGRGVFITDGLRQLWQAEINKYADMVQEELIVEE